VQYVCLIYTDEQVAQRMGEEERDRLHEDYFAFTESIQQSGNFVAGDALEPVATATTVRVRNGETLVTDGPFAETKEQLGSCYRMSSTGDFWVRSANLVWSGAATHVQSAWLRGVGLRESAVRPFGVLGVDLAADLGGRDLREPALGLLSSPPDAAAHPRHRRARPP
jgi:hypothetical protein